MPCPGDITWGHVCEPCSERHAKIIAKRSPCPQAGEHSHVMPEPRGLHGDRPVTGLYPEPQSDSRRARWLDALPVRSCIHALPQIPPCDPLLGCAGHYSGKQLREHISGRRSEAAWEPPPPRSVPGKATVQEAKHPGAGIVVFDPGPSGEPLRAERVRATRERQEEFATSGVEAFLRYRSYEVAKRVAWTGEVRAWRESRDQRKGSWSRAKCGVDVVLFPPGELCDVLVGQRGQRVQNRGASRGDPPAHQEHRALTSCQGSRVERSEKEVEVWILRVHWSRWSG